MGGNGAPAVCSVAVEAGSRFLGEAIAVLLEDEGVVAAVSPDGVEAGVDVVVLHVNGDPADEVGTLVGRAHDLYPGARVLVLANTSPDRAWEEAVGSLGVAGWLSCETHGSRLADAILEVHRTGALRPQLNDRRHVRGVPDGLCALLAQVTPREAEILHLLVEGQSTEQIAGDLAISPQTVRAHVQNLMAKLGAHSRVQIVRLARSAGMTPASLEEAVE